MSNPLGFKEGDRVRLVFMPDDPDPVQAGTLGTVRDTTELPFKPPQLQVHVNWDNGRTLSCVCPPDIIEPVLD